MNTQKMKAVLAGLFTLSIATASTGCVDGGVYVEPTPTPVYDTEINVVNNSTYFDLSVTIDGFFQDTVLAGDQPHSYIVSPGVHTVQLSDYYTGITLYYENVTAAYGTATAITIDDSSIDPIMSITNTSVEPEYCVIADVDGYAALDFTIANPSYLADPSHICGGEIGYMSLYPTTSPIDPDFHTVSIFDEYTEDLIQTVSQHFSVGTLTDFQIDWF